MAAKVSVSVPIWLILMFRHIHQALRLAVAFRVAHAEIMLQLFARAAPALLSNHHHRLAVKARKTADHRAVITE